MAKKKKTKETGEEHLKLLEELQSVFGAGEAMLLSDPAMMSKITTWCSSGSMVVDKLLAGGREGECPLMPFGRQIELSGDNGTGKTTLCAMVAASVQKMGGLVVVVDTEERIDEPYWRQLGVDTSHIVKIHASNIEDVFEKQFKTIDLASKLYPDVPLLLLWDSVGGTSASKITEASRVTTKDSFMEEANKMYGREAKILGAGIKMLNSVLAEKKVMYLYTNHIYSKMNVRVGSDLETPGGRKLKYFATVRLQLVEGAKMKVEDELGNTVVTGKRIYVKALKNSMSPNLMEKEAYIIGNTGFNDDYSVLIEGKKLGYIATKGGWSTCNFPDGSEVKFQGWKGFQEKIIPHEDYANLKAWVYKEL